MPALGLFFVIIIAPSKNQFRLKCPAHAARDEERLYRADLNEALKPCASGQIIFGLQFYLAQVSWAGIQTASSYRNRVMSIQIEGKQIAAARQLADLTVEELAKRVGVSRNTITNFENGAHQPRGGTLAEIVKVFAGAGVEFTEGGVRWTDDTVRIFEGPDTYLRLLDEVHQALHRQPGAEVLFICIDDAVSTPEIVTANNRIRDAGIRCRYLTHEKATRFDFPLRDYRLIPERYYTNSVMLVYGNTVATLSDDNKAVIVVRDTSQANMLRGLFEMIWQQCPAPRPPPRARP
jgi:transcriptional regulator with XRE-family HTH domain